MDKTEKNRQRARNRYYLIRSNPILLKRYRIKTADSVKKWRIKNPEKVKAQRIVFVEIRAGRLKSQPCDVCGLFPTESHHENYSEPLNIRWLCKKHHREADKERRFKLSPTKF
jgi:hypothetical protein